MTDKIRLWDGTRALDHPGRWHMTMTPGGDVYFYDHWNTQNTIHTLRGVARKFFEEFAEKELVVTDWKGNAWQVRFGGGGRIKRELLLTGAQA